MKMNKYVENTDLSLLEQFVKEHGVIKSFAKKEIFLGQGCKSVYMGFVATGTFRYIRTDKKGNEHIIAFAFQNEYIAEYAAYLSQTSSLVTIQAVVDSVIYMLPLDIMYAYWETSMETQRLGRVAAEQLYVQFYERVISLHSDTPEERYLNLIKQHPDILNILSLKDIASYLSVTPETVSHIRKKILTSPKS
jgi:CRP-like cAMP-binding protein